MRTFLPPQFRTLLLSRIEFGDWRGREGSLACLRSVGECEWHISFEKGEGGGWNTGNLNFIPSSRSSNLTDFEVSGGGGHRRIDFTSPFVSGLAAEFCSMRYPERRQKRRVEAADSNEFDMKYCHLPIRYRPFLFPLLSSFLLAQTQLLTRLDFRLQSCPTPPFIISSFHHSGADGGHCASPVRDKNK